MEYILELILYTILEIFGSKEVGKPIERNNKWDLRKEVFSFGSLVLLLIFGGIAIVNAIIPGDLKELGNTALIWVSAMGIFLALKYSMVEPKEEVKDRCEYCDYVNRKGLLVYATIIFHELVMVFTRGSEYWGKFAILTSVVLLLITFTVFLAIKHSKNEDYKGTGKEVRMQRRLSKKKMEVIRKERAVSLSEIWVWRKEIFGVIPMLIFGHFVVLGGIVAIISHNVSTMPHFALLGILAALSWTVLKRERKHYLENFIAESEVMRHFYSWYSISIIGIFVLMLLNIFLMEIEGIYKFEWLFEISWVSLIMIYIGTRIFNIDRETAEKLDKTLNKG